MKEKFKKNWGLILVMNLIIFACLFGYILFTLTYKSVPVSQQHLWFGTDLHTYLIWEHSLALGIALLWSPLCTFAVLLK